MTALQKGDLVYTRHGERARVLQAYCDHTVCIVIEGRDQVLHVDRRWVYTLEESFGQQRAEAIETVLMVGASLIAGAMCALVFLL